MAYLNGQIPLGSLTSIGNGMYLEYRAAIAWNLGKLAVLGEMGLLPIVTSPDGAYRDLAGQYRQKAYWIAQGMPGNAATPGYSSHGWGVSVDIYNITKFNLVKLETILKRFGFSRDVPRESWHFTHNGTSVANLAAQLITSTGETMADKGEILNLKQTLDAGKTVTASIYFRSPVRGIINIRNPYELGLLKRYLADVPGEKMMPGEFDLVNYYLVMPVSGPTVVDTAPLAAVIKRELAALEQGLTVNPELSDADLNKISKAVNDEYLRRLQ